MSSSLYSPHYINWCVDPAESQTTATVALASKKDVWNQNQQLAAPSSTPLLLLSPPETDGGEANAASSHQHQQPTIASFHNSLRPPDADVHSKEELSSVHLQEDSFHLPRSSLVISRCSRPISWHGGIDESNPSLGPLSPAPVSLSLDGHGRSTSTSVEDLVSKKCSNHTSFPAKVDKKQCSSSISSNLKRFLTPGLHLPYSGQQGLPKEHKQRSVSSCVSCHTPGLSTSKQQSKGRSSSDIPESSAEIFKNSCELEKENAHFIVVDMVLEMLESAKWTLSLDQRLSRMNKRQPAHRKMFRQRNMRAALNSSPHKEPCGAHRAAQECSAGEPEQESSKQRHSEEDTKTSHRDTHQQTLSKVEEEEEKDQAEHQIKTLSLLSIDSGFEDCGVDHTLTQKESLRNAEQLAQQLVLDFKRSWLPSKQLWRGRQSLRSSLQELPGTGSVAESSSSLTEKIRQRTRMRGSLTWAPPRFQIIFTVQPTHRRSEVVALQHFLCAGCGTEVEPRYIKKLRYCDYLGRYFCDCCHSGSEAVIPGRVLSSWDFSRHPVSDFSKQLLESVWHQPLFDLTSVGKTLYSKVKELDKFRELQDQLVVIKKLLKACRLSGSVVAEFEHLPAHLMEQPNFFSMDDLHRAKKGQLVVQAKAVLRATIEHIEHCELCLARGFICEFCRQKDILFPFQRDICKRCPVCKACFHKQCFVEKSCPKCTRIQSRKKRRDGSVKSDT